MYDFKKIVELLKENPISALVIPLIASFTNFFVCLIDAVKDGRIDATELHALTVSSSGLETLVLALIMFLLKIKK